MPLLSPVNGQGAVHEGDESEDGEHSGEIDEVAQHRHKVLAMPGARPAGAVFGDGTGIDVISSDMPD
jgi:hypothetical protein